MRINESDIRTIVGESVRLILEGVSDNLEVFYRGYNSKYGSNHDHMLWITDDISYARAYGNRVEEITVDTNKLKVASIFGIDDILGYEFDYYEGLTEEEARLVIAEGYNGYCFYANGDDSYCICLFDTSPIVSRRVLSREEFEDIEGYEGFDNKGFDDDY